MNDSRVITRLVGIGIAALLSLAALAWVVYYCWIDRSWAHVYGDPIWIAWMGPLVVALGFGLILVSLSKYFRAIVKPMWKGI